MFFNLKIKSSTHNNKRNHENMTTTIFVDMENETKLSQNKSLIDAKKRIQINEMLKETRH